MAPTIGRIVIYHIPESERGENNGNAEAPAIITHVWSDECVNLKVFNDHELSWWKTSVQLGETDGCWSWPVIPGGAPGFTNPIDRPVVDGDKSIMPPFELHKWRIARDIGNFATEAEALRYTEKSRRACLAQADWEQANLPEEKWEHFEPRW